MKNKLIPMMILMAGCLAIFFAGIQTRPATAQSSATAQAQGEAAAQRAAAVPALDAQNGLYYYDLFREIVARCPLDNQDAMIELIYAIDKRFAQAPGQNQGGARAAAPAAGPDPAADAALAQRIDAMMRATQERIATVPVVWTREGAAFDGKPAPLDLARGVPRFVLVQITNLTNAPLQVDSRLGAVAAQESSDAANERRPAAEGRGRQNGANGGGMMIAPGAMRAQLRPVSLQATGETSSPAVGLVLTSGGNKTNLKLPVRLDEPATIKGTLLEKSTGEVFPGRVWVQGSDSQYRHGKAYADIVTLSEKQILNLAKSSNYALPFFYSDGRFEIIVPAGKATVTLERGFEHPLVSQTIDLKPGETREVTLESGRFLDMKQQGWVSGDTHVHWSINAWNENMPIEQLGVVQRAEDLRVANNLTLRHNNPVKGEFIAPTQFPMGPVPGYCGAEYHIQMAEEYRNGPYYGHLNLLNLKELIQPISTGEIMGPDALDYPTNRTAILEARRQGGIVIEAHGLAGDGPANVVDGLADSIDQISPQDYYNVLNAGFRVPITDGSDHPARVTGICRAYVKVEGPFTYQKWIDGIRAKATFNTSGPLLFLTVNGKDIGEEVAVKAGEDLLIEARAESRFPLGHFQLVIDGEVVESTDTTATAAKITHRMPAGKSVWVACRASQSDEYNAVQARHAAHTSPIYVVVDGKPIGDQNLLRNFAQRVRGHGTHVEKNAKFANDAQRQEAVQVYTDAAVKFDQLAALYEQGQGAQEAKGRR